VRDLVSAKLGRPVSDEMWADLVEQGFVDDAEGKPHSERASYLADRIKQLMAVANSRQPPPGSMPCRLSTRRGRLPARMSRTSGKGSWFDATPRSTWPTCNDGGRIPATNYLRQGRWRHG
jgi:hypothetical protein